MIDFNHCVPEVLAKTASLADILTAAKAITTWSDRTAEVLDYIYRTRLARLLKNRDYSKDIADELLEFSEHLERITHPGRAKQLNGLTHAYGERWLGYLELLEDRINAVQNSAAENVLERKYVRDILELLITDSVNEQAEIRNRLKLTQPNLTRVLDLMENNELIARRKRGRKNFLELGVNGERFRDLFSAPIPSTATAPRGSSFLQAA